MACKRESGHAARVSAFAQKAPPTHSPKSLMTSKSKKPFALSPLLLLLGFLLSACAPQREFVRFDDAGTFRPQPAREVLPASFQGPSGEYDSYELIDHGAPNHGIPPLYGW
jgi:hypothetical protein